MKDNKAFWDRCAAFYRPIQEFSNRRLYAELVTLCKAYIQPTDRVLELACGSGQLTLPLCGCAASWEATDFSEPMIRQAEKFSCAASFSVQDATRLPYENKSFDLVLIGNALHIMPRPEMALSEIRRVLKPGGILLAPTFVYEGKVNKARMWVTNLVGFQTYHQWNAEDFCTFVTAQGFRCMSSELVPGDPLPVAFGVFRRP